MIGFVLFGKFGIFIKAPDDHPKCCYKHKYSYKQRCNVIIAVYVEGKTWLQMEEPKYILIIHGFISTDQDQYR
jgi:hypothetical protein